MERRDCSLHIGRNDKDPQVMRENDGMWYASQLCCQAAARGLKATALVGRDATSAKVLAWIDAAAQVLQSGDVMLVTYLGHGAQVADQSGDEDDSCDEAWALTKSDTLLDDVIFEHLLRIAEGVEVRFIVDACHSATSSRKPSGNSVRETEKRRSKTELKCNTVVPKEPITPRCSVFTLAASRDRKEADFGKLSARIVDILETWHKSGVEGTWDELRAKLTSLGVPPGFDISGKGYSEQMTHSRAFYPRI